MRFSFRTAIAVCCMALAVSATFPDTSWALLEKFTSKKKQAAPPPQQQYAISDDKSFAETAKSFHQVPFNDPRLEFDILLPKDWTSTQVPEAEITLQQRILGELARFKSPLIITSQAEVTVQAQNLEHEISAENWLKNYLFISGYVLQDKINVQDERKASASFIFSSEEKSTYNYITAQVNKNVVVTARFESPLSFRDYLKYLREKTVDSFKLINTTDEPVEQQKNFILPEALKIYYPASWAVKYSDVTDLQNQSIQLHNENITGRIEGLIRVVAVKRTPQTSLIKEVDKIKDYFTSFLGLEIKTMTSSRKSEAYGRFPFSRTETYQVAYKKREEDTSLKKRPDQELRLTVLGDKDWYIFAFVLTPQEKDDLYNWARNTQTFSQIIRRLR